jgi:hypothetical protein
MGNNNQIKKAQAEWVCAFLTSKPKCQVNIDGPIGDDSGCIRVRFLIAYDKSGGAGPGVHVKGVVYLDAKGKEVVWDTQADRPKRTPSGRILTKGLTLILSLW